MSPSIVASLIYLLVLLTLLQRCGATGSGPPETGCTGGLGQKVATIVIPVSISIIILLVGFIVMRDYQKKWKIALVLKVTSLQEFSYGNIRSATGNFAKAIGEGGFGKVYKGTFRSSGTDDRVVLAVKCVTDDPLAGKQLLDELMMLARLEHRNVVKLKGFCNNDKWFPFGKHGKGLYVCNEFFSQGSLDRHIFASANNPQKPLIGWPTRYQIIHSICVGLQYLHEHCNNTIAHLDLKPNNILLDQEMRPKIADFGISRTFLMTRTHTYTRATIGTNGYMAPELTEHNSNEEFRVGRKCDIYSLGVLIMAIVMGQGPPPTRDPNGVVFIGRVLQKFTPPIDREQLKRDLSWLDDDCLEDVERCIGLAFECVNDDPNMRPAASDICSRLPAPAAGTTQTRAHVALQMDRQR